MDKVKAINIIEDLKKIYPILANDFDGIIDLIKKDKEEVIIEAGREKDELHHLIYKFYNEVNKYNEEHKNQANVVILARDVNGGASIAIGDTEMQVREFLESAVKHKGLYKLLKSLLKALQNKQR